MTSVSRRVWHIILTSVLLLLCVFPALRVVLPENTVSMSIFSARVPSDICYDADRLLKAVSYVLDTSRIYYAGKIAVISFAVLLVLKIASIKYFRKWMDIVSVFLLTAGSAFMGYTVLSFANLPVDGQQYAVSFSPVLYLALIAVLTAYCSFYIQSSISRKTLIYVISTLLAFLSLVPFWIMIVNATRSTAQINQGISLLPSIYLKYNWDVLKKFSFDAVRGFMNSLFIAVISTGLCLYFSALTAYGFVAYRFRGANLIFSMIVGSMMIPGIVGSIGYYQAIFKIGLMDTYWPLIIPSMASPATVFFFRQYLAANYQKEITEAGRVDGGSEWHIFNVVIFPIMKPVLAISGISSFVGSWNNYFTPLMILNDPDKMTIPLMVQQLTGNDYKTEYGSLYLALTVASVPLFLVYGFLSRYIVKGVSLGAVKG